MHDLIKLVDKILPLEYSNNEIAFNESENILITTGYTSYAGNTYFQGIRLSERILIISDIGIGYCHTFLNAVTILTNQSGKKKIVGRRDHYNVKFSEKRIKDDAIQILKSTLLKEAENESYQLDETSLDEFVKILVEDTYKNQLETLRAIQQTNLLTH